MGNGVSVDLSCHFESFGNAQDKLREKAAERSEAQPKNLIENEFLHYVQDKPAQSLS